MPPRSTEISGQRTSQRQCRQTKQQAMNVGRNNAAEEKHASSENQGPVHGKLFGAGSTTEPTSSRRIQHFQSRVSSECGHHLSIVARSARAWSTLTINRPGCRHKHTHTHPPTHPHTHFVRETEDHRPTNPVWMMRGTVGLVKRHWSPNIRPCKTMKLS